MNSTVILESAFHSLTESPFKVLNYSFCAEMPLVAVWQNVTKVADYDLDGSGDPVSETGITPYKRFNGSATDCYERDCFEDVPNNTFAKCGPWPIDNAERGELNPAETSPPEVVGSIKHFYENAFEKQAGTIDPNVDDPIGWKGVAARKSHHGRLSFVSCDNLTGFPAIQNYNSVWNTYYVRTTWPVPGTSPDTTRYLTLAATSNYTTYEDDGTTVDTEDEVTRQVTVGRHTGIIHLDDAEDSGPGIGDGEHLGTAQLNMRRTDGGVEQLLAIYGKVNPVEINTNPYMNVRSYVVTETRLRQGVWETSIRYRAWDSATTYYPDDYVYQYDTVDEVFYLYINIWNDPQINQSPMADYHSPDEFQYWQKVPNYSSEDEDDSRLTVATGWINLTGTSEGSYAAYSANCTNYSTFDGYFASVQPRRVETETLTDTTMQWRLDEYHSVIGVRRLESVQTVSATLSTPYPKADLQEDLWALQNWWNLADDAQYPWRIDPNVECLPIVMWREQEPTRTEVPGRIVPADIADLDWTDWRAVGYEYSGGVEIPEILGKPVPAGYDKYFDWDHPEWEWCPASPPERPLPTWRLKSYGRWSTDGAGDDHDQGIPAAATLWHHKIHGGALGKGAWWRYDTTGVAWAQKVAFALVKRPAYNFFGPCGQDRYALDEFRTGCVSDVDGITLTVDFVNVPTDDNAIATGTLCYYNGKIWSVTRNSDSEYELTTEICTVPTSALPASDAAGYGLLDPGFTFGPLRFPDAWPIGGKVVVESTSETAGVTTVNLAAASSLGDASWLRVGDYVRFVDEDEVNTGAPVLVASVGAFPTVQFTFTGSLPVGATHVKSYVNSADAPPARYFRTASRGDFVTVEYTGDHRTWARDQALCVQHVWPAWSGSETNNYGDRVTYDGHVYRSTDDDNLNQNPATGAPYWVQTDNQFPSTAEDDFDTDDCNGDDSDLRPNQAANGVSRDVSVITATARRLNFPPPNCIRVVCVSPNAEVFPYGITIPFTDLNPDLLYGASWQMRVIQHMIDPLWQSPHRSCAAFGQDEQAYVGHWNMDISSGNTACADDYLDETDTSKDIHYYPQAPWVEARIAKIDNDCPDLPPGFSIAIATTEQVNYPTWHDATAYSTSDYVCEGGVVWQAQSGNVNKRPSEHASIWYAIATIVPPVDTAVRIPVYDVFNITTGPVKDLYAPAYLYVQEEDCVCATGRWATVYASNGVVCPA